MEKTSPLIMHQRHCWPRHKKEAEGQQRAGCQLQEQFAEPTTCSSRASEGFRKEGTQEGAGPVPDDVVWQTLQWGLSSQLHRMT